MADVDFTTGSITVRLGGVASYCESIGGWMVQADSPAGVEILSYTYSRAGTAWQAINQEPVNDNVAITSTVATGTRLQSLDAMVVGFTWGTRPSPTPYSANDEIMAINVVPYGPLTGLGGSLIRPTAIGNPNNPVVAQLRSAPLVFDNATIAAIPSVVDLDDVAAELPGGVWAGGNPRPNIDDYLGWFGGFCGELWKGWGSASYTPSQQHPGYGASMASQTGQGLLMVVSTEDAAKRRELARRMTQWGIDLMGAFASGRSDIADGGHYQGRKALIVLALHLLETGLSASALFPGQFNEDIQFYTASPAWVWGWPYGYRGKSDFSPPMNIADPIASWNGTVLYYLPQYFQQEVCGTQVACALAMRILGLTEEMGVAHDGMMAQFMEGPTAENIAAMTARSASLGTIDWGFTYSLVGSNGFQGAWNFGNAAWTLYSDYSGGEDPPPPTAPRIAVSGNSVPITNNDSTPDAADHTLFGSTTAGGSTISRTFTVENTGDATLTIASVTVPSGYTVTTALPGTIAASGSASLIIRLDATVAGTKYGPVSIVSDDAEAPKFEFFVTGTVSASGGGSGGPSPLPAFPVPVMRLRNHSTSPFRGWVRTTTDRELTGPVHCDGCEIVPARRIGLDVHAVDVWCNLSPNEERTVNWEHAQPSNWQAPAPPADPVGHFGGLPLLNGQPMIHVGLAQDGAGWRAHYALRLGRMFLVDLWLRWYPDQPAVVEGECMVTCSNADVPDMGEVLPELRLAFGDGRLVGKLPKAGMRFADGQARAFPVSFVWFRHLHTPLDWSTAGCIVHHQIGAVGIQKLLPHGNPTLPADFNLQAWAAQHWNRSYDALTTWEHPQLGPAADTGQTGAVEDQCFVGGEFLIPGGTGAEWVNYFAALATSGHPMHHYEADGTVVDKDRRPGLRLFYSRPHSSGSDRLNKGRDLSVAEANGWNGPDAQHWTINRLAAAARLKDSPACQRLLECHARNYLIQLTTTPGWSTSAIWSSRELGWEGIAAVHLYRCLEDRGLAERVKAHWQQRVQSIILPWVAGKNDIWDVRRDDLRLGTGDWWMPWQQALGVYGLDLACEILDGPEEARLAAYTGALRILNRAWQRDFERISEYELLALDGRRQRSGMFATAWMPLAVATVLRHESGNALAREVWQQIVADANGNGRWLDPGVLNAR